MVSIPVDEGDDLGGLGGRVHVGAVAAVGLTAPDDVGDDVDRVAVPREQAVVQRRVGRDVLDQQHGERADQFGRAVEPLCHPPDLGDEVPGRPVGVRVVVGVAGVEHRVEQLLLGLEMMQQPGRGHPGFLGDLGQRGVAPAVARQQSLGHGENPLLAVVALGKKRGVRSAMSAGVNCRRHRSGTRLLRQPT